MIPRLAPLALLLLAAACSDGGVSTLEVGSGGARMMGGQPQTPLDAYDQAYASFARAHHAIRRDTGSRSPNLYAARESLDLALKNLRTMHSMAQPQDRPKFDPHLAAYEEFLKQLERGTWGGSWSGKLDLAEREARSALHPNQVAILEAWPGETPGAPAAKTPTPSPVPAPKPSPEIPGGKVDLPPSKPAPAPAPGPAAPAPAPAPVPSPALSSRLVFKAWDRAHDDLAAAVLAKKDCRQAYEDVIQALKALKDSLPADRGAKLQIYLDYYADVNQKTKGFTTLPEKTTEKDVVDELSVAARVIRKEYAPEK